MGGQQSLHARMPELGWRGIAIKIGAPEADYEAVRHAAKHLQDTLPGRLARGTI
jgi:hypothetical protein